MVIHTNAISLFSGIGCLDLGIKLDEALRREICGLDGRALLRKGGPFASLKPNQLPNFVQSLYIDFASEALEAVTSSISGGNAVAAKNLVPTISNYPVFYPNNYHSSGVFMIFGTLKKSPS